MAPPRWPRLALAAALALLGVARSGRPAAPHRCPVTVGRAVVRLTGPWKFHVGDDMRWADPAFDDSSWEDVDLTAPPGAHDDDVGLSGYVPGWGARGHAGYFGYAWYRLHISPNAPRGMSLSLAGPPSVDNAYQVFLNGTLWAAAAISRARRRSPTASSRVYSRCPRDSATAAPR